MKRNFIHKLGFHVTVIIVLMTVTLIINSTTFFHKVNLWTWDYLFRIRGEVEPTDDIVIVSVNDETFTMLNTRWPFPREYFVKLIENLERAEAKQIVFDIEFTEQSDPYADALLGELASKHDNIVWAGKVIREEGETSLFRLQPPIPEISNTNAVWGMVNMSADMDGFIRNYPIFDQEADFKVYSLGMATLATEKATVPNWQDMIKSENGVVTVGGYEIPLAKGNRIPINYYGPEGSFKYYSFSSVLDDESFMLPGFESDEFVLNEFNQLLAEEVFKGKTVFIGVSTAELHDSFNTPFNYKKVSLPGVEIHANFVQMVRDRRFVNQVSLLNTLLILLLFGVLLQIGNRLLKPQLAIFVTAFLFIIYMGFASAQFIKQGEIRPIAVFLLLALLSYGFNLVQRFISQAKEKKFIKNAFQRYLAPEVVSELLKNPKSLTYGGSEQEISVLFSDIRSFTTYSESHKPEETVAILSEYLTAMVEVIKQNKGILDKFVGDEIMALYGTPLKDETHALNACKTALDMRVVLNNLQAKWQAEGKDIFEIGIGVNSGKAVVGNLGSEQIFDYTAIGDNINLGARLESINKEYQTEKHIIISEYTLEFVKDKVEVRYLDQIKVKGKNIPVKIYELISLK
ncbi:MAG: adenylate/guanylate cyclase domain-containing protein [Candidatus Cloacimonetes bacterium]|nr:adenylate/guanylate cyclase domain-containing protein [Candidatus Cloacimonadota bacterium]